MPQKTFNLPDIGKITVVKRRGSRNIRLGFSRQGDVRISLPYWVPYQTGLEFARNKRAWIEKHLPEKPASLNHGDRIGKAHRIAIIVRHDTQKSPRVNIRQNLVTVSCPANIPTTHQSVQAAAIRGALKALKKEADSLLPARLAQLARQHGFDYSTVATKRLSSRWGSCSQLKNIVLNTYLMQLPWDLIDYVIIHELVHTEHLNHSDKFWARFEQVMPDAKKRRKSLKQYRTEILPG